MAAKSKPYEQFGAFVLFKKFESDGIGELWRASRIDRGSASPAVALRKLTGGNREVMIAAALAASRIAPQLSGTSFVRNQALEIVSGTPCMTWEFADGRSLRYIVDHARGTGANPNPIPLDQAVVIAERVALSLATTAELRSNGDRLSHGALIPQFIWISEEGEIRVAGQQLGRGIGAALKDPKVAAELGRYFPIEMQQSGDAARGSDIYSLGAILFLMVTGQEPPDPSSATAFSQAIRAAKTMSGQPIPLDIRTILDKSLTLDPTARFTAMSEMKGAVSALSTKYAATTFNLAFYLSNLLKADYAADAQDREREGQVDVQPYVQALAAAAAPAPAPAAVPSRPTAAAAAPAHGPLTIPPVKKRGPLPIAIAAVLVLAMLGGGAWYALGTKEPAEPIGAKPASSTADPLVKPAPAMPEPIVASATPATATAPLIDPALTATMDPEGARKKAFEDAVKKKLQEEMMKLQAEYTRQLQAQQSRNAPVLSTAAPVPAGTTSSPDDRSVSAAQLDQQRRDAARPQEEIVQSATTGSGGPAATQPPPAPVQAAVREGDVIEYSALDRAPEITRRVAPIYPPLALRTRAHGTVLLSALVTERGEVADVKILKGENRLGFDEAAVRCVKAMRFNPAIKDGKRVKTWLPIPIQFKQ